jgi:hypothetical protein
MTHLAFPFASLHIYSPYFQNLTSEILVRPFLLSLLLVASLPSIAQTSTPAATPGAAPIPAPVTLTNPKAISDAQKYRDVLYRYSPELASADQVTKYDTKIADVSLAGEHSKLKDEDSALKKLMQARDKESDSAAQQELSAYISSQQALFQKEDDALAHQVNYINAAAYISDGLKPLLDSGASTSRHIAAGERMKRYAGLDPDPAGNARMTESASIARTTAPMTNPNLTLQTPSDKSLVTMLIVRTTAQMKKPDMVYPTRDEVIYALSHNNEVINGMLDLFRTDKVSNWEQAFAALQRELVYYDDWVKQNLLPRAR